MLALPMAAPSLDQTPSVWLEQPDDFAGFHRQASVGALFRGRQIQDVVAGGVATLVGLGAANHSQPTFFAFARAK
jgi:hypothetical protein